MPLPRVSPGAKDLLILTGVCFLCFFWRLGSVGLFDFNEGFYTQVAREMVLRGDYVTPRVNGILFFDKPPLALWLSALSFHVFGFNEFAARFPVALAASALVFLTYAFGARFFGRTAGLLAGAMVALNPLFYGTARQLTMDIHQSLWFAVALFSFYTAWHAARTPKTPITTQPTSASDKNLPPSTLDSKLSTLDSRLPTLDSNLSTLDSNLSTLDSKLSTLDSRLSTLLYHLFWVSCGLAVLAKSIPGLFPLGAAFVFVAISERGKWRGILARIWEARILTGLPLMLLVTVPWFYLAWRANGRVFYEEFWLLHHMQLARGGDFNHAQPFWYYLPALLLGFFPWSLFLPWAIRRPPAGQTPDTQHSTPNTHLFLVVWAVVVFLVFSAMKSKLVSYLLPMYPAAALLVGEWMARAMERASERESRGLKWGAGLAAAVSVAALGAGMAAAHYISTSPHAARQRQDVPPGVIEFAVHALLVAAAGTTAAAILIFLKRAAAGVWAMLASVCVFIAFANVEGLNAMEAKMNAPLQFLAREAGQRVAAGEPLAIHIGQPRRPSVFFYLPDSAFVGKPVTGIGQNGIVLERGEIEPVMEFLDRHPRACVLTDRKRADELMSRAPGLRIIDQRDRWLLLLAQSSVAQRPNDTPAPR